MKKTGVCVVIPIYRETFSQYEMISLSQCLSVLGSHDIYIVLPNKLLTYIKSFDFIVSGQVKLKTFSDTFFVDIPAYNKLLKSPGFYNAFSDYEYMLIHQLDAFVFEDKLEYWTSQGYDDIGAPLFEGHDLASENDRIVGQGNGGFCLRNISSCLRVLRSTRKLDYIRRFSDEPSFLRGLYRKIKHNFIFNYSFYPFQPIINEDLFWAEVIPEKFNFFKVPDPSISIKFSFEVNPQILYSLNGNQLPFGCHAWWRYNFAFWKPHIENCGYSFETQLLDNGK